MTINYKYIDGYGNHFHISNNSLKYSPMTAELSSSGTYDGGEPFIRELNRVDMMRFVDVVERAIWSSPDHSDKKEMGCATITKTLGDEKTTVYLNRNSEAKTEIEDVLEKMKHYGN